MVVFWYSTLKTGAEGYSTTSIPVYQSTRTEHGAPEDGDLKIVSCSPHRSEEIKICPHEGGSRILSNVDILPNYTASHACKQQPSVSA